eukprot:TRINITY_DN6952_c0_g1_i1.p1 TRINITY_DN6952_c0_g1~~TRINITY_DN6952_c0_g1_i1.p1  ORF type:complete len:219 (-),score=69.80 TRINITY_DN6952_c0_g1_i1:65-721(-)
MDSDEFIEIKVTLKEDIRKIKIKERIFEDLISLNQEISKIFSIDPKELLLFRIQYRDEENDMITISNSSNLEDINRIIKTKKQLILKLMDNTIIKENVNKENLNSFLQINFFEEMIKNENLKDLMNHSIAHILQSKEFQNMVNNLSLPFLMPTKDLDNHFHLSNFTPKGDTIEINDSLDDSIKDIKENVVIEKKEVENFEELNKIPKKKKQSDEFEII